MLKKAYFAIKKSLPRLLRRLTLYFYAEFFILLINYFLGSFQNFLEATQIMLLWALIFTQFMLILLHFFRIFVSRTGRADNKVHLVLRVVGHVLAIVVHLAVFFLFNMILSLA